MSLLTVGTVAFDSIETPFGKVDKVIGGAATYICWAASYFYDDLNLVSVVGDDWPGDEIVALQNRGVDTTGLQIKAGEKSFFWKKSMTFSLPTILPKMKISLPIPCLIWKRSIFKIH